MLATVALAAIVSSAPPSASPTPVPTASAADCGFVEFLQEGRTEVNQAGVVRERVKMSVRYADGRSDFVSLDWYWYYPSTAADPFSSENLRKPVTVLFQSPPADKLAKEPFAVKYVMAHTTPEGKTTLEDCPSRKQRS